MHTVYKITTSLNNNVQSLSPTINSMLCSVLHQHIIIFSRRAGKPPQIKPLVVTEYNKYILGVDRLDQRMAYYKFERKSVRWWRKVFFWMLEVVVVNSYILYSHHTDAPRKLSHKQFRRQLVVHLCEGQHSTTVLQHLLPPPQDVTVERLRGSHFAELGSARRDCRMCSARGSCGQRHLTRSFCATCSDHPHLCIGECFRAYHTQANI